MKKLNLVLIIVLSIFQFEISAQLNLQYPRAEVNFDDYERLVKEVKCIREERLLPLNDFLRYSKEQKTVILDTRSRVNYNAIHIKGAINLPFTEFTTANLRRLVPDPNTRILIYCNNNIKGDPINFASKVFIPQEEAKKTYIPYSTGRHGAKYISLALNVPTYINLYGYGYRNIYELDEFVDIYDDRVEFEKKKPLAQLDLRLTNY